MFYHDGGHLQYHVRVDSPDPIFAKALQQAIGGIEGEIRVALQYLFQAWGSRGPKKYRDMLLHTGTEELAHIEMLATAVALNLEDAPLAQEEAARDPMMEAVLGGMNPRHVISTAMCALPVDASGVPFDCSHIYASGNLAADMLANAVAESTGRMLAVQLYKMTNDEGMKDMLRFLIARDAMHQNQWLAVWEEIGGPENHPIPNNFPQDEEIQEVNYSFITTGIDGTPPVEGRWTSGRSIDGKGQFRVQPAEPVGGIPDLGAASPDAAVQQNQMDGKTGSTKAKARGFFRRAEHAIQSGLKK